jgi:SAM-dependent methyltransferase
MSRLDSFIRRLLAQRDILNAIAEDARRLEGDVLELGLGNGRTYDHLRELFPGRRIVAFDRDERRDQISRPDDADMVVGEIQETIAPYLNGQAALVHADIGTGHPDRDAVTLTWLPNAMAAALARGGIAVSGLPLEHAAFAPFPQPEGVPEGRYFLYRRL